MWLSNQCGDTMIIKEVPKAQRPREKALALGIESLMDYELLAIILRSGSSGYSVLELAKDILEMYPLEKLSTIRLEQLTSFKGVKQAKALHLLACFELSNRISTRKVFNQDCINSPHDLLEFIQKRIGSLHQEHFLVVNLDVKNHVINFELIFKGSLDISIVHPREIFNFAISNNAAKIICAHNHPSGNIQPSKQDLLVTKALREAGELLGIELIDHIIVSNSDYYSIIGNLAK